MTKGQVRTTLFILSIVLTALIVLVLWRIFS